MRVLRALMLLCLSVGLSVGSLSCSDEAGAVADAIDETGSDVEADADADATPPRCDDERLPIVFVHGFLSAGDHFSAQAMRFASNGYCIDRIFAFDWNTLGGGDHVSELDEFVDDVLSSTGAERVDVVGHSAGGALSYDYLDDEGRAAKVAHYAHVASLLGDGPAGPAGEVPTLNLWSDGDQVISEKGDIPGATNTMIPDLDHVAILTSADSFRALYGHFNDGAEPATVEIAPEAPIRLSGRVLSLGENVPAAGGSVDIFEIDVETGARLSQTPVAAFEVDEQGDWGSFDADPGVYYEFRVRTAGTDDRPVHYYREPFVRTNPLVYMRVLPDASSIAGILLNRIRFDDAHTVLAVFLANNAVLEGRDSLVAGGYELATEAFAAADQTTVALFVYDANGNGETDLTSIGAFESFPFLTGVDGYFPTEPPAGIEVTYNGRTLRGWSWPSGSEGPSIVVFE